VQTFKPSSPTMQLHIRRAEPRDLPGILALISTPSPNKDGNPADMGALGELGKVIRRRYGENLNFAQLIDVSPMTLVCTDSGDNAIYAFFSLSNGPPPMVDQKTQKGGDSASTFSSDWEAWIKTHYEAKDIHLKNTKFIAAFVSDHENALHTLDLCLSTSFTLLPQMKYITYLLPDSMILFPPFSAHKYVPPEDAHEDKATHHGRHHKGKRAKDDKAAKKAPRRFRSNKPQEQGKYFIEAPAKESDCPFVLEVCPRKEIIPPLKIRKARVEDCDDLLPMLKRQNMLQDKHYDYYLADMLESKNEENKTLVAEAVGEVVGFMSLTGAFDQTLLTSTFGLDAFDNFKKEVAFEFQDDLKNGQIRIDPFSKPNTPQKSLNESEASTTAKNAIEHAKTQSNAFCVSLFCIEDTYANQAHEFIKFAFELFSDRDYCAVSVPSNCGEIPLMKHFTQVPVRANKVSTQVLYVANRFGLGDVHLGVRRGVEGDLTDLEKLVSGLASESEIYNEIKQAVLPELAETSYLMAYVAEADSQLVGCCILETLLDLSPYSEQFDIEEYINLRFHALQYRPTVFRRVIMNPLFEHQAQWFFEEVFRQADITVLLYPVDTRSKNDYSTKRIALREFFPVRRRRRVQLTDNMRDGSQVSSPLAHNLQILTSSLLYEPKITVNSRIVVIGGSDVGISFLESLVYSPHLFFSNLTLISKDGITLRKEENSFILNQRCYTNLELKQMGLDHFVEIVHGSAIEIDRVLKRVLLNSNVYISYDFLILSPGVQFSASNISEEFSALGGVFSLNPCSEDKILSSMETFALHCEVLDTYAVVYGNSIQAYAAINGLLSQKAPANRVILVSPPSNFPTSCFDNDQINDEIHRVLKSLNLPIYRNYRVSDWNAMSDSINSVTIKNKDEKKEFVIENVELFLYADKKSVDPDSFKCINDSSLVFDNRLVVDKYFRTQDPFVYAAGSVTKYSSKYRTPWIHAYCDSREVGQKLAEFVLPLFDPTTQPLALAETTDLLKFSTAKKAEALLPGNLHYLHFDKPRLPSHTLEWRRKQSDYGRDLIIHRPPDDSTSGYFRIHVDPVGYIQSITYVGTRKVPTENILSLYGLHERYLNQMISRFDEGIIKDFVCFLNEPWALPLYHDRFQLFAQYHRQAMLSNVGDREVDELRQTIMNLLGKHGVKVRFKDLKDQMTNNLAQIPDDERVALYNKFDVSIERRYWDENV
ncbi:hypothetical protein BJ742DRAFT_891455, partial [Cladochytrium replicatum]